MIDVCTKLVCGYHVMTDQEHVAIGSSSWQWRHGIGVLVLDLIVSVRIPSCTHKIFSSF